MIYFFYIKLTWFVSLLGQLKLPWFMGLVECFFLSNLIFLYIFFIKKNHIIRLYKVIKTKGRKETIVHPHLLHYDSQCFAFFFLFPFSY